MSTTDSNQIQLLEIYRTITIAIVLFRGLVLIYIIHIIKVQQKNKKRLQNQKVNQLLPGYTPDLRV